MNHDYDQYGYKGMPAPQYWKLLRNSPRWRDLRPLALAYIVLRHRHRRMPQLRLGLAHIARQICLIGRRFGA